MSNRFSISKDERRWVLTAAIVVMLITMVPYVIGYAVEGEDWRFIGFVFGAEDGNSYIAKMLSGAAGSWLFRTPYTAYPQNGVLAFFPFIILGKLTAPPGQHEQLVALFHIFRICAGILAILATYDFLALFISRVSLRRWGVMLITLGGGLGWLLILAGENNWLGTLPLEFYSPESFGFLEIYGLPHLVMVRALFLWGLRLYLLGYKTADANLSKQADERKPNRNWWVYAPGLLWLIMGLFQPLSVVTIWAVIGAHLIGVGLWEVRREGGIAGALRKVWSTLLKRAALNVLVSAPIVVYSVISFSLDPFLSLWTSQNRILSPHPAHYLIAYGLFIPLAILGVRQAFEQGGSRGILLVSWFVLLPLLAYAPYNLQRRLPDEIFVPLIALFFVGIESLARPRLRWLSLLAIPSTLVLFVGGLNASLSPTTPLFRPVDEVAAFEFLAANAQTGDIVLSAFETGNSLPAWAPVRVVIGHGPESVNFEEIKDQVADFYSVGMDDNNRRVFLRQNNISYILWGPLERELGMWDLESAEYLEPVFWQEDYRVFQVKYED